MKKVCVCGHFGFGKHFLDGQTVKTKVIADELENKWGDNEIYRIDTHGRKNQILLFIRIIYALMICKNVVILPSRNSLKLLAPWMVFHNLLYRRRLHYLLIGGWLYDYLKGHKITAFALKYFYCIYPENTLLTKQLKKLGYNNVITLPNCKKLEIVKDTNMALDKVLPLVVFSRVMKRKGIGDAVNVVKTLNEKYGTPIYTLDIYGPINSGEEEWFSGLRKQFTNEIRYMGCVDFDKTTQVLSRYFLLIFPTQFPTEGIPGTIIDAYAAGVPVVSAKWNNYSDIMEDGVTGYGYEMNNINELESILLKLYRNPEIVVNLKTSCSQKATAFLPENVIQLIKLK